MFYFKYLYRLLWVGAVLTVGLPAAAQPAEEPQPAAPEPQEAPPTPVPAPAPAAADAPSPVDATRPAETELRPEAAPEQTPVLPSAPAAAPAQHPNEKDEPPAPSLKAGADGFQLQSADQAFVFKLRGYLQADARFYIDGDDTTAPDTFLLRRVRPIFEGTLYRYFGFRIMPDWGGGQAVVQDAHVDVRPLKEISLRFGKYKAPVGLERLQSATNLFFVERGLPTQLVPNRDIGAQLYGELWEGALAYAVGVFNGVPDVGSADTDADKHKDFAGRLFGHPLRPLKLAPLKDLGLGVAASHGRATGTLEATGLASYRTPGQQTFFRYLAGDTIDVTAVADGQRRRVAPQAYYFYGPIGLLGEYVRSSQRVTLAGTSRTLTHQAWQAAASIVIGGKVGFEGVKPDKSIGDGGYGAFELVGRYQELSVDRRSFPTFANPDRSARSAKAFGVGAGLWATRGSRFMVDFERTTFEGGAAGGDDRRAENTLFVRTQASW
jgi:phosphate-selective porin OprO and OprP